MSVQDLAPLGREDIRPLRRVEYDRLVEAGVFSDERLELIGGLIVRMSPQKSPHASTVQRLTRLLIALFDLTGKATVRVQLPFIADEWSEPEPDVALVPVGDYVEEHPVKAYLLIEVADDSLAKDRGAKARLYAGSGVPEYWIVNLRDQLLEVHSEIVAGSYSRVTPYRPGSQVAVQAFSDVLIAVADVLGAPLT